MSTTPPCKFIVVVHGIGNQVGYATAQAVVAQVGTFCGTLASVPLGSFYPTSSDGPAARVLPQPRILTDLNDLGVGEVYWAGIAREVTKDGYILEETKKWARTIVARMAARAAATEYPIPDYEHQRLLTVLDELIQTVAVLGRLTTVADKAGLFKVNLSALLNDFVGDVQIVADFAFYRQQILDEFSRVMTETLAAAGVPNTWKGGPDPKLPEIYLVGHSEGSVIVFLGVLTALAAPSKYAWVQCLRGMMTIGSPIEVHHLLWPELWKKLRPAPDAPSTPIPWHNYLDHGDPIAYELTETRRWIEEEARFDRHLDFPLDNEHRFTRSFLPGKAHTDYWSDEKVFGHFFENVVHLPRKGSAPPKEVPSRRWAQVTSYVVPPALIATLLIVATFVMLRAVQAAVGVESNAAAVARDIFGIGVLLLGITAVSRIPRLTRDWTWRAISVVLLLLSMAWYAEVTCPETRFAAASRFAAGPDDTFRPQWIPALLPQCGSAIESSPPITAPLADARPTLALLGLAVIVAALSGVASAWWPRVGIRVLPALGLLGTLAIVGSILYGAEGSRAAVWPIALASAGFFYLWWLAALLFDLTFVWNVHVRYSGAVTHMSTIVTHGYVPDQKSVWTKGAPERQ